MPLPVIPCTPPAISIQAKPESGPHTFLLATAGVPVLPASRTRATDAAPQAPRSVRPFDHLGACYVAIVSAAPLAEAAENLAQPLLHLAGPVAASLAPRP
jgi:hypothetical protein